MQLTSEYFDSVGLTISQPQRGYRYGGDTLALADFARARPGDRVAELCSGVGVISLIIAARDEPRSVAAVEIQKEIHEIAMKNVFGGGLAEIVSCVNCDYRDFAKDHREEFDLVVANPPFLPAGEGRLSPDRTRVAAHHEIFGTLADLVASARTLLIQGGRFALIIAGRRREELGAEALRREFEIVRTIEAEVGGRNRSSLVEFKKI